MVKIFRVYYRNYTGRVISPLDIITIVRNIETLFIIPLWTDLINLNKDLDGDGVNDNGFQGK